MLPDRLVPQFRYLLPVLEVAIMLVPAGASITAGTLLTPPAIGIGSTLLLRITVRV